MPLCPSLLAVCRRKRGKSENMDNMNSGHELALISMHRLFPPRKQQVAADCEGVSAAEADLAG